MAVFVYAALALVFGERRLPDALVNPIYGLDASYQVALGELFGHGLRFGRDLVFTYGPLGFLAGVITPPAVLPAFIVGNLVGLAAFVGMGIGVARRSKVSWWLSLVALCVLVSVTRGLEQRLYALAIFMIAYFLLADDDASTALLLLGASVLGAAALVKFTFFPLGIAVAAASTIGSHGRRRRQALLMLLGTSATPALVWWSLYGTLSGYPSFLAESAEIARGYGAAMQLAGPASEIALFLLATALVLTLQVLTAPPDRRAARLGGTLALGAVMFVIFKHGFVRHDGHASLGWSALGFLALSCLTVRLRSPSRAVRGLAIAGLVLVALLQPLGNKGRDDIYYLTVARADVGGLWRHVRTAAGVLLGNGLAELEAEWTDALHTVAARNPLPRLDGTVDLYPWDLRVLFAHHLDWHPRPVFQSYAAYTDRLLRWNAEHLRDAGADNVLISVRALEDRFPALDDGLSWLALLERYRPVGLAGDYVLLKRTSDFRAVDRAELGEVEARFGETVVVPETAGGLLWATIDLRPTAWAALIDLAYKLPVVRMTVTLDDGTALEYRLVPAMARAGFLLSPLVAKTTDLLALLARDDGAIARLPRVRTVTIGGASPAARALYADRVAISFSALRVPDARASDVPG